MLKEIASGVVGAATLTAVHETARQYIPGAPRIDIIGKRAIARPMKAMGLQPPAGNRLYWTTLAAEVVSNGVFYGLVGAGGRKNAWRRGIIMGAAAGLGAAFLPPFMGLGRQPQRKTPWTQLMTIAWYLASGVAAAAAARCPRMEDRRDRAAE